MTSSFVCSDCGETHEGMPTDYGWQLPDVVWAIAEAERPSRAKFNGDLCKFGDRRFIRCLLKLPFHGRVDDYYTWGIWVETSETDFQRYLELYDEDGRNEPSVRGTIANAVPGYANTIGLPVLVRFQNSSSRPTVHFPPSTRHGLADEQREGLNDHRYHQILAAIGH